MAKTPGTKKRALTCYFDEEQHHRLWVGAQIAQKPMSHVVGQAVAEWLERNARAIDAASKVLRPENLV